MMMHIKKDMVMRGEGCSSTKKMGISNGCSFTDILFSWSLDDISDENLLKDKIEKIPESFQSIKQYFGSFVYPLLEETRAQLFSAMDTISRAPFAEVVAFEESELHGAGFCNVTVDNWRNRFSNSGKEPYKTLPGDILILADAKPETVSDLQSVGRMWSFLSVINIPQDEDEDENETDTTSTYFKVKASKGIQVCDGEKSLFVIFLTNITPNKRIWKSLHMSRNLKIIKEILFADSLVDKNCKVCSKQSRRIRNDKFCPSLSSTLNDAQEKAILACLDSMNCDHKPSIQLIWGPPGTGKTKAASLLLFTLLRMKCRTLACAPTNVAIAEVASHVLRLLKESCITDSGRENLFCYLGDILLFGKERLKVGDEILEIYLDYRIKRLLECFSTDTGWRHCFSSMIDLLENCISQYQIFLKNSMENRKENSNEHEIREECRNKETEGHKGQFKSFLEFVRQRFDCTATPLRNCIFIFCTHVPQSYILENNFQHMVALISLLDSFKTLLFQDNLVSEDLQELFSHSVVEDLSLPFVHEKYLLHKRRSECHTILRILWNSFNELDIPTALNKDSLKDFCFKTASVIFCTGSCSFKLHKVDIEPLNILVVDEAAQMKESELIIPLQLPGIRRTVLIGDEFQLPAMVESNVSDEAGFGRSLFERLSSLGHSKHLLNVQYRMHPSISYFPNSYFYHNQISDSPYVESYEKLYLPESPIFGPYSFINVFGGREEFIDHSCRNMVEVAVVMKILWKLYKDWNGSKQKLSIGIISPYNAQVVAIQEKLGCKYENSDDFTIKVKSIDGFQGGEEDIIIISTVRSNRGGSIGFVSKPQRINVALTRARHCLWILGSERALTRGGSVWESLICDAKNRHCFFNADEDKDLAKAILKAKKELDQLDELLNAKSILFRNQRWKVVFSDNVLKSFKKMTSDRTKKSVINLLLKLSSGWRPKSKSIDLVCESSLHIVKQFKVEGLYVVCTIDIRKESQYIQILKVWDILPLENVPKLVKRLDDIFVSCTDDYINRCKEKHHEGKLEVPKTWPGSLDIIRFKNLADNKAGNELTGASSDRNYVENSKVRDSLLLMKFYALSPGVVNHLLSDCDGRELDLPFEVTDEQLQMILFPRSTFIVGRSGTGKTTVLTMKLFQKEKLHYMAKEEIYGEEIYGVDNCTQSNTSQKNEADESIGKHKMDILCQLFVTVNPKLCFAVKQYISHLKSSAIGEKFSAEGILHDIDDIEDATQFKDIPNSFVDIPPTSYPLVLTFHKFLMMLDGTLGNSYFERFHDVRLRSDGEIQSLRSVSLDTFMREKEVSYDRFSSLYWPHFNTQLTKKLDCSRVFTEIISHIKGGQQSMEVVAGKLSQEEYVQLSEDRISRLSRQKRERIYEIFQNYERMKMANGDFDLADLVIDLHHRLKTEKYEGDEIDFVYIDEVQDLTMTQIALFKYICRNVEEGFVFSGDTAQTISRGIDFRFQDIRSLFHKKFLMESRKGQLSEILNLSQNFRTHEGVLKLAQSIIDLLYRFFRHSIDVLNPETSMISGELPVLLECGNNENAIIKLFGNNGSVGGNLVGFGAEQVILVRDDRARKYISDHVGKQALVLTIVESKGLEFEDVLLYNFFYSSPLKNQWRVIYEYMKEQNLLDSTSPRSFPSFNDAKHNILCAELKQLYVAITRTRQRLWIWEEREDVSKPMFDYWKKKFLVQVKHLDDSLAHAMQVASSAEEWKLRGMKLFYEHNYEMATLCFERANDFYWVERSKATALKAEADHIRNLNPEEANVKLRQAAAIFEAIGKADSAAKCFYELGEYERAGTIYYEKCDELELERAGECFYLAGRYKLAAEVYAKGNFLSECLNVCSKGKLFDVGMQYIHSWKQHANTDAGLVRRITEITKIEQDFLESCARHHHELKNNKSMMKFVKAFHSMDLKRDFLKSLNCFDELISLEEEAGNFVDAINIVKMRGDILRTADLLKKAGNFKEASTLILNYVFSKSLWSTGSKGWPLKQFRQKEELLEKAKSLAENESTKFSEFVLNEADILSNELCSLFMLSQLLNASKRHQSIRGEILSVRKILDVHLDLDTSKYGWEDELVSNLTAYSEDTICKNRISVETLVYFWNYWKDKIVKIFEYLERLQTQDVNNYKHYEDFCLNYLGVWKQCSTLGTSYLLLNSDATWVRELDRRHAQRSGKLVSVGVSKLVSAARTYWSSELLYVGRKVLENLGAVQKQSTKLSSGFCQVRNCTFVYEVSKFLLNSKFLSLRSDDRKQLQKFVELSTDFFDFIFPVDWRESLRRNLISLRRTEICRSMIKEAIFKNIGLKSKLSYQHAGSIAVMILGSGKPNNDLFEKVTEGFDGNTAWKEFIESLSRSIGIESQCISVPFGSIYEIRESSLIQKFHGALQDTFAANWRKHDYISPSNYLYLIERFLILLSSIQGYILTSQSSFVDWIIYQEKNTKPASSLVTDVQQSLEHILEFVVYIVRRFLYNAKDTEEWIRKSYTIVNHYHSLVVLRLVVIICLLHLNFGNYKYLLLDLLGRRYISDLLPWEFCDSLRKGLRLNSLNGNVIAEAFKRIGNPLVIVSLGGNCSKFRCPDAIFVDMRARKCTDILNIMFPKFEVPQGHSEAKPEDTNLHKDVLVSPDCHGQGKSSTLQSSNLAIVPDQDLSTRTIIVDKLLMKPVVFWEALEALDLVDNADDLEWILLNAPKIKLDVEQLIHILTIAKEKSFQSNPSKNQLDEAASMLVELNKLYDALDGSDLKVKNNISTIEELCKRLQSKRPTMEPLFNQLFLQYCTNLKGKAPGAAVASVGKCDAGNTNRKIDECNDSENSNMEALALPIASGAQGNRQETDNKGTSKSRREQKPKT